MAGLALEGLRIVELGGEVSAAYATKLLADLGAEVWKVEPPGGDPLRAWGPFPGDAPDLERGGGLFRYLNTSKRSVVVDLATAAGVAAVLDRIAACDAVVENLGARALERLDLAPGRLERTRRGLALVRISPVGQEGPYRDIPVSDLTLQAMGGWVSPHGVPEQRPVQVGGRIPEYVAGSYAACATLAAVRAARDRGQLVTADLSILECLIGTLPYPMLFNEDLARVGMPPLDRRRATLPGIVRCKNGWVGINALTGQHWQDICAMLGLEQYAGRQRDLANGGPDLEAFFAEAQPWLDARTAEEIVEIGQAFRIPTTPIGDGRTLLECAQFRARAFFVEHDGFRMPGPPYRFGATPAAVRGPAPRLSSASASGAPAGAVASAGGSDVLQRARNGDLPLAGLRIVEIGNFWAGPYAGLFLGAIGADVIKIESIKRPDGFRFAGAFPQDGPDWYERSALWQATNLNKRDLTLDLAHPKGAALVRRLIGRADVVIENFSARVVEQFGLGYAAVRAIRPDVIMVRMPGFGLEGPWRNWVGWAMAIEQASGMAALTGDPDQPLNPGGFLDPVIGMHAALAVLAALEHRRRTGEGQMIEVAQLEVGACLTAEQVIDWSMNRRLAGGEGNRSRACAPQGVYPCSGGQWVALSVRDDDEWQRLVTALGRPAWATAAELERAAGRHARHDELDTRLAEWTCEHSPADVVALLRPRGVPVADLIAAARMYDDPQLVARGYYQALESPHTGLRRYPGWPIRFSFAASPHRFGPPSLGSHNAEVLGWDLGLSAEEIASLAADGVIGDRMVT